MREAFPWLFDGLPEDEVNELLDLVERITVAAGAEIITFGEHSDRLFFVPTGKLSILLESGEQTLQLAERGEGAIVGELGCIRPGPASATVRADEDMQLFQLTNERLKTALSDRTPLAAARLLAALAHDIAERVRDSSAMEITTAEDGAASARSAYETLHIKKHAHAPVKLIPAGGTPTSHAVSAAAAEELEQLLTHVEELKPVGENILKMICRSMEIRTCEAGDVINRNFEQARSE